MIIIFCIICLCFLYKIKVYTKDYNREYMDKHHTTIINGFFVVLVLFSHFQQYIEINQFVDVFYYRISNIFGQLMVTTFLFYSGYGIYENIKRKKENYIKGFIKKRLIPTIVNFWLSVGLFVVANTILGVKYPVEKIILSFTGYESIGNSNWYMMAIFVSYAITWISFKLFKSNKKAIFSVSLCTVIYMFIISITKESFWFNTILCYPFGMIYSYYKERIEMKVMCKRYYLLFGISIVLFVGSMLGNKIIKIDYIYNICSILFICCLLMVTMKVNFNNKIFEYIGKRTFWIYILQRIPMIILQDKIHNLYLFFIAVCMITIFMSEIMYRSTNVLWKKVR